MVKISCEFPFFGCVAIKERKLIYEIPVLKNPLPMSKGTVNLNQQQADVFIGHPSDRNFFCPKCSETFLCYDTLQKGVLLEFVLQQCHGFGQSVRSHHELEHDSVQGYESLGSPN